MDRSLLGKHVRLSAEGREKLYSTKPVEAAARIGVVTGFARDGAVRVKWDSVKYPVAYALCFVEAIEPEPAGPMFEAPK